MDGEAFAGFEALRRRYYAPERNLVPAHVTLFHRLPAERAREIKALLGQVAAGARPIEVTVGEARVLEDGVAIFLHSPRLHALHDDLADEWRPWLVDSDRRGFRPHITIQTTESAAEARRTVQALASERIPRRLRGVGLHLWRYLDGPWRSERLFRFR
jgi:2'-5' RNA ligase